MTSGQRSKLDNYKDTLFIVTQMLGYNEQKQQAEDEQVSIVLGENYLISFVETNKSVFAPVRERLRNPQSRIRQRGVDYLCYSLLDCIVDNYFLILEKIDAKVELLEHELIQSPEPVILRKIQHAKREVTLLRKSVWPMREVVSNLRRIDSPLVLDATKLYLHDVYDHTIQAIDTIESFRDITSGMLDIYLSNVSQRMNEVMKVLTIVATIFVPLTFIASLYGMNFDNIPELHTRYGYYIVLFVMALIAIGMIIFFRRKRWI
jgi:magnesium transporter